MHDAHTHLCDNVCPPMPSVFHLLQDKNGGTLCANAVGVQRKQPRVNTKRKNTHKNKNKSISSREIIRREPRPATSSSRQSQGCGLCPGLREKTLTITCTVAAIKQQSRPSRGQPTCGPISLIGNMKYYCAYCVKRSVPYIFDRTGVTQYQH